MPPKNNLIINILLAIIIVFFAVLLIVALAMKINSFSRELDYIKREIGRTTGAEQRRWKREKRRLWLSLLPFYRR
ncbi:MAG: hypothetical protein J6Q30_03055 [Oscillospiraceae bacterium]|nr:hypothetical protein [Oscillospiraceae bacterium]